MCSVLGVASYVSKEGGGMGRDRGGGGGGGKVREGGMYRLRSCADTIPSRWLRFVFLVGGGGGVVVGRLG